MPTKVIMRWDVLPESESDYFEFLVHEFIPTLSKLGAKDILVWYTAYGDCEQKLAEGITDTLDNMKVMLRSQEWADLLTKLQEFVADFSLKVVPATRGFQI